MGAFVKKVSDLLSLLIQQFRLAAFVPAAILVIANVVFVLPLAQQAPFLSKWINSFDPLPEGSDLTVMVMGTIVVGYTLAALNIPIIRFFEGYSLLGWPGSILYRSQVRVFRYLKQKAREYEKKAEELGRLASERNNSDLLVHARYYQLLAKIVQQRLLWEYPGEEEWRLLPTRLGNVIAAAEAFPNKLYRLDAVALWPYLVPILVQRGFTALMEKEKSVMDFLLNMSVISIVLGGELGILTFFRPGYSLAWLRGLYLFALFGLVGFVFYLFSIPGAMGWGLSFRAAFVLYKDELRRVLGLVSPKDYYDELWLWQQVSKFYRDKDSWAGRLVFRYPRDHENALGEEGGRE